MNYVFAKGKAETNAVSAERLFVNNCGCFRDIREALDTRRTGGRKDYHLIFVRSGMLRYADQTLGAGSVILFMPGDRQEYTYLPQAQCLYYWAHFSGSEAQRTLDSFRLTRGVFNADARAAQIETLFRMMIDAYIDGLEGREHIAAALLYSAIALVAEKSRAQTPLAKAIQWVEDLSAPFSVGQLARTFHMSEGHFIRTFRQATGYAPHAYRVKKQIEHACALLTGTALTIGRVAQLSGFSDPLYFSRVFKKSTGYSPSAYRAL